MLLLAVAVDVIWNIGRSDIFTILAESAVGPVEVATEAWRADNCADGEARELVLWGYLGSMDVSCEEVVALHNFTERGDAGSSSSAASTRIRGEDRRRDALRCWQKHLSITENKQDNTMSTIRRLKKRGFFSDQTSDN